QRRPPPGSAAAPAAGQPGLLFARQRAGPVIVFQLAEAGGLQARAPAFEVVVAAIARAVPAFAVVAPRVGTEQHAAWFQAVVQLAEYLGQLLVRDMEQAGIGEDAVERSRRQVEGEKVLLPDFAAAVGAGHGD